MLKEKFEYIVIILLMIVIFFLSACPKVINTGNSKQNTKTKTEIKTEIKWDTVYIKIPNYVPKPYRIIVHDTIYGKIDTLAILQDFFSKRMYIDSIHNDTLQLYIMDIISQNKIIDRKIEYKLKFKTTTNTITNTVYVTEKAKRQLYYGIGLGANQPFGANQPLTINYVGAELLYKTRAKQAYGLSFGLDNNKNKVVKATFMWRLGK